MYKTYSFADTTLVLSHPAVGQCVLTGVGLGSVTIGMTNDTSQHDVAADGNVMISKIKSKNGTMALAIQQVSAAQEWLDRWNRYLEVSPTAEFAETNGVLTNVSAGVNYTLNGITPQKAPDVPLQQTGQQVTWNMLVAEVVKN